MGIKEINKQWPIDFRILFESAPGLFLILFPDLTIAAASDAYLEAIMAKRDKITGRNIFTVFTDNPDNQSSTEVSDLHDSFNMVLKEGVSHTMAIQKRNLRRTDGSFQEAFWRPVNKPVFNSGGNISYIIHWVEDVTQLIQMKQQEMEQVKKNEKLRVRISEMEIEIYQGSEEIQKANTNLIKEINERINIEKEHEVFTYSVSHDLRAPLRSIDGYTKILIEDYSDKFDEQGKRTIHTIIKNTKKMERLIGDLLTFSRIGKNEMVKTEIDMNHLVLSVIADFRNNVSNNLFPEIEVRDLKTAFIDHIMIKQVWTNLISNALKYSAKKEKTIIQIGSYIKEGNNIYFIKDNGIGFDMQYAHKLFGIFQRLHKMDEFEGTGAGLAIIKKIILKHGGKVWAEGEVNKGATFYFSIPEKMKHKKQNISSDIRSLNSFRIS